MVTTLSGTETVTTDVSTLNPNTLSKYDQASVCIGRKAVVDGTASHIDWFSVPKGRTFYLNSIQVITSDAGNLLLAFCDGGADSSTNYKFSMVCPGYNVAAGQIDNGPPVQFLGSGMAFTSKVRVPSDVVTASRTYYAIINGRLV